MKWRAGLAIGENTIDSQHEILFKFLNLLETKEHLTKEEFLKYINFLVKYAKDHFDNEERIMLLHRYPQVEAHKKIHIDFKKEIDLMVESFNGFPTIITRDTLEPISVKILNWLLVHIEKDDKKFGKFLAHNN